MTEYYRCHRCHEVGHWRQDCPHAEPLPPAAPARDRAAERWQHPGPPPDPAIARKWADIIRDTLGWGPPEERTRD